MGKNKQLYDLRLGITDKSHRIQCLLENVVNSLSGNVETQMLADIALDEAKKIRKMSEKIGIILKH